MVRPLLIVALLILVSARPAFAQSSPALPDAGAIGPGWTLVAAPPATDLTDAFTAAQYGAYGGPHGARAIIDVWLVATGPAAIRSSWELVNNTFDGYRSARYRGFDYTSEGDLAALAPPPGCVDARRIEGVDDIGFDAFPLGMTLCATDDPPLLILAIASGEVAGLSGAAAADALVAATLAAQSPPITPTA